MNKTVLFLINGLGIEHSDSCDIYSKEVMPVMDECAVSEMFTQIESSAFDYTTGYQIFSTGSTDALAFPFIDKIVDENAWSKNPVFQKLSSSLQTDNSGNLHIFCFLDSPRINDHLKNFITALAIPNKKVFVHPIMTNPTLEGYKSISKTLAKMNYESSEVMTVGMVFGKNLLDATNHLNEFNDLGRMFFRGNGEKWSDVEQKINSLQSFKIVPTDSKTFCVNDQFALQSNDTIFFYNYDNIDCSKFVEMLINPPAFFNSKVQPGTLHFYSLFPLTNTQNVENLYGNVTSEFSMAKALKQYGIKALVLVDQANLSSVNYMINGLSPTSDGTVDYALTDSGILFQKEQMRAILANPQYSLIVINHRIDTYSDETSIKQAMKQIDDNLAVMKELCKDQYTLVISSLFGIKKEIMMANGQKETVNFSNVLPVIIIDSKINRKQTVLARGSLYSLLATIIKFVNPEAKVDSLLKKKGFLQSILYK